MTIDRWISDAAARCAEKPALIYGDVMLSYSGMATKIDARAKTLAGAGIRRGDRVAWYGLNHPEVFILLFACARIGAMLVPLNWRLAEGEIKSIVENCEPKLLIHDQHFAEQASSLQVPLILPKGAPIASPTDVISEGHEQNPLLIVYTAGSTGRPKGVILTQEALIANAEMSIDAHRMTPDDIVLNMLPLFHVGGLNILPTPAFSLGATVILHERFEPISALNALQHVHLAIVVPTVLQAIMAAPGWTDADLSRLRALSIGSTDVPIDLIEAVQARGVPMLQIYGATETSPLAIYQTVDEAMTTTGSIGRAGAACEIQLVRPDGAAAKDGEPGEIWVAGKNILQAYWRDTEETARALEGRWFRTGDIATRGADGLYWFADRIKHVIISGGENIYPAELERVLRRLPAVKEAAVVGRADPKWGEVPVAVVVPQENLNQEDVFRAFEGRIARYKHPKAVVFVDALPRNAMGKVVAAELRSMVNDTGGMSSL